MKKKETFSEDDLYELLQRYNPSIIITLLQEISEFTSMQSDSEKIDWKALVKSTCTGISNAREYQMLWRHLAYKNSLLEKIEDGSEPLDDDSDLELELELVPAPGVEELAEAKESAKILLSSGPPRDSGSASRSIVEPSLTEDITNDQVDPSDKLTSSNCGANQVVPVLGQKQPLAAGSATEDLDGNGSGSGMPAKKKRQLWTKEEDIELIAAVQKCGEGNWANILKGDFKHNRTASQLSQRWAIIRKRQANSNPINGNKTGTSTLSEERLAAQKAFSMAVNMPMTSISSKFSGATQAVSSSTSSAAIPEASHSPAPQSSSQSQEKGVSNPSNKPRAHLKKPTTTQPLVGPNPLIQAAAFAAGGRIANPSTAASLFKAAQSKHVVHIRPGGGSLPIPSAMMTKPLSTCNTLGPQCTPSLKQVRPQPPSATFGTIHSAIKNPLSRQASLESSRRESIQGVSSQEKDEGKSGNSNVASATDAGKLSCEEVGGDGAAMRSKDAVNQKSQMDGGSNASAGETQAVVEKNDQMAAVGAEAPVKEDESGNVTDTVNGGQSGHMKAVAEEVMESSSREDVTVACSSNSPVKERDAG